MRFILLRSDAGICWVGCTYCCVDHQILVYQPDGVASPPGVKRLRKKEDEPAPVFSLPPGDAISKRVPCPPPGGKPRSVR